MKVNETIGTIIKRNCKIKNGVFVLDKNDLSALIRDLKNNVKIAESGANNVDRIERLRVAYLVLCELAYTKQKPETDVRVANMESSLPVSLPRLSYKIYIDKKIDRLIEAICSTLEWWK
ncbi:MAG: hypothetical protein WC554_02900 [Clostridia bacterium]